jgi:hypothetical protein
MKTTESVCTMWVNRVFANCDLQAWGLYLVAATADVLVLHQKRRSGQDGDGEGDRKLDAETTSERRQSCFHLRNKRV